MEARPQNTRNIVRVHSCHTAPTRIKEGIYRKFMHFKWRRDKKKTQYKTKGNHYKTRASARENIRLVCTAFKLSVAQQHGV